MVIPYGKQSVSEEDVKAVVEVLTSDFLTQGPVVPRFERALASSVGATDAVVVNSGTAALHVACLALSLGEGDVLWTSPISFVASANCARYCGASVDFVDVSRENGNICIKALELKLAAAAAQNCLPKVLVAVHLAGNPCDLLPLSLLLKPYGVKLIEDASHAIGARYRESSIGDCAYSDLTVFSFHPVKVITSGEGGCVLCKDSSFAKSMRASRQHGLLREASEYRYPSPGDWYYEQQSMGWNYRMTDIQAALGHSQLTRCNEFVQKRNDIAAYYRVALEELPCEFLTTTSGAYCSYHLFVILVEPSERQDLFSYMRRAGIGVQVHYIPIHTQPYYRDLGFNWGMFPDAEYFYSRALSLPIFPSLTADDQGKVIDLLKIYWS